MGTWLLAVAMLAASGAIAAADTSPVNGFVTEGAGELTGSVTLADGAAGAGVSVHVVGPDGAEKLVTADQRGAFRVALGKGSYHVFITGEGRVTGTTAASTSNDVIELHDIVPPAVAARAKKTAGYIPAYSDAAEDADTWTRAWLMLHVDAQGKVTHVKLLEKAGFDLDEIAVREAFALQFEPARDANKRPVRSLVVWTFEWPAYWWMRRPGERSLTRLPPEVADVPCRRADKPKKWDRDCRGADMKAAASRPWVAKKTK
jgi:hypothetical protein